MFLRSIHYVEKALPNCGSWILPCRLFYCFSEGRGKIMAALGVGEILKSSVSRITKALGWKGWRIPSKWIKKEIPYLLIDATYFKVRDLVNYENKAFFSLFE